MRINTQLRQPTANRSPVSWPFSYCVYVCMGATGLPNSCQTRQTAGSQSGSLPFQISANTVIHRSILLPILILNWIYSLSSYTRAWFFCLVFHREQTVSWAELRQVSVKSPARVELSLAYSLLTVENQTKKPGPDHHFAQPSSTISIWHLCSYFHPCVYTLVATVSSHAHIHTAFKD